MRLLNCRTLKMKEFFDDNLPSYAILSHTWGDDEVSYQDFQSKFRRRRKLGFKKIKRFCTKAASTGNEWVWVDTCCIDKASSAELSEAINSMFHWYRRSHQCFVYLSDVDQSVNKVKGSVLRNSRWFTRGWTLQELLAPSRVSFYDKSWSEIGTKISLSKIISEITNIPEHYLLGHRDLKGAPIAQRISWASNRKTSRREDIAYCLLGLLNVNMPLLYGEGDNAFIRLQEEAMQRSYDHSILASGFNLPCPDPGSFLHIWTPIKGRVDRTPACLPKSPDTFCAWDPGLSNTKGRKHYLLTNLGIYIGLSVLPFKFNGNDYGLALLHCGLVDRPHPLLVALPLRLHKSNDMHSSAKDTILASRPQGIAPFLMPVPEVSSIQNMQVYLTSSTPPASASCRFWTFEIHLDFVSKFDYCLADFFPPCLARISNDRLIIEDTLTCSRIFRFCHPTRKTILLSVQLTHQLGYNTTKLKVATITDALTSWQLVVLGPKFDKVDFEQLQNSLTWTSKGSLNRVEVEDGNSFDFTGEISLDLEEIECLPLHSIASHATQPVNGDKDKDVWSIWDVLFA
ncbi:HET-domain-containing protein [Annulohypoxylon truncatum]|uniref:HET-domain-containing protein n=1 Tax=Annulohypoxylon truncatum TaxID=327061 RepID=UPI002007AB18|nr:HET-domain-containing protein [Annulohypoxylon truncatum]KAI1210057.1 HET-domain-containing protein [Annulohypoxylon truncatum]